MARVLYGDSSRPRRRGLTHARVACVLPKLRISITDDDFSDLSNGTSPELPFRREGAQRQLVKPSYTSNPPWRVWRKLRDVRSARSSVKLSPTQRMKEYVWARISCGSRQKIGKRIARGQVARPTVSLRSARSSTPPSTWCSAGNENAACASIRRRTRRDRRATLLVASLNQPARASPAAPIELPICREAITIGPRDPRPTADKVGFLKGSDLLVAQWRPTPEHRRPSEPLPKAGI